MKTETNGSADVIWSAGVELPHFTSEECLPVIGSCQVSSILSNLDSPSDKNHESNGTPQNMEFIVLHNPEYGKISENISHSEISTQKHFMVVKERTSKTIEKKLTENNVKKGKKVKSHENLEDMLYFVCNICPFLCTENAKITEHLENIHRNKTAIKLMHLKCPACPNIFYHKVSLRSHLIHDHNVCTADLNQIIQAVIYFSKKNLGDNKNEKSTEVDVNCKNEIDLKYADNKKLLSSENYLLCNGAIQQVVTQQQIIRVSDKVLESPQSKAVSSPLGNVAVANTYTEKVLNATSKQQNSVSKFLDQKKMHKCIVPMCKVQMQDVNKMNYHIGCHADNNFNCIECNEIFPFWKPLTGHLWRVHKIDMELYSCDKCDYKTFSLSKLNNIHKLIHSDVKAFICEICHKGFKNSKQMRNHKITHKEKTEKSLHTCEICEKNFFDKRQLRLHLDGVHRKIKPFLCNFCGYKGSSRSALKMHIRQHTGEKPFACDSCNYSTADHNSLRRHKLRHSGVKPYKCAHCDYACIQSSTYKVHLKTKHPGLEKDLMFTCTECQFRFVNRDLYNTHLITAHKSS